MQLEELLLPTFSADNLDWDTLVSTASLAVDSRELYQKVLGKIATTVAVKYGERRILQLADAMENMTGHKVSPETLRNYRWVWTKVGHLNLPQDIPYTAYKHLAAVENPEEWVKKLIDNGWSAAQLAREIRLANGEEPKKPKTCPVCGTPLT